MASIACPGLQSPEQVTLNLVNGRNYPHACYKAGEKHCSRVISHSYIDQWEGGPRKTCGNLTNKSQKIMGWPEAPCAQIVGKGTGR
jgi:hypothetical protein